MSKPDNPTLYAMTSSKDYIKKFKKQRNMKKFVISKGEEDYCDYDISFIRDSNLAIWLSEYGVLHCDYDNNDESDLNEVNLVLTSKEYNSITAMDELLDFMVLHISKKNYHNYFKEKYFVPLVTLGYVAFKELNYSLDEDSDEDFKCYYGANDSDIDFENITEAFLNDIMINQFNYFAYLYSNTLL